MSRLVCSEKNLIKNLKVLARSKSSYKNKYPYNLLYWDGERWWADCVNLYKALFNGRDIYNPAKNSYQKDLSNTGDVDEWGLMKQCSDISQDFSKLGSEFRCLYMNGHFGGYLGEEWEEQGQGIVNCVEATLAWEDGIQFSYVDSKGQRFWRKGGEQRGVWTHHGKPDKFIDYKDSGEKEMNKYSVDDLAVHIIRGDYGNGEERKEKLSELGYTQEEMNAAQKLVDLIYQRHNKDIVCADIAIQMIGGTFGDGIETRKQKVTEEFGDESYFYDAQKKVNAYLE